MYIVNYNGFTLENDTNHTIDALDGISRVDIRRSEDFLTSGDGGNIWERRYGMRIINLGGEIFSDDITEYYEKRNEMLAAFQKDSDDELLTITTSDGLSKAIYAKVVEVPDFREEPGELANARYATVLKCQNPFFQDTEATSVTVSPGVSGGTMVSSPVPSPVGMAGGVAYITNNGDVVNTAKFTITGLIVNPSVFNMTTGEQFTIETTIGASDILEIYQDTQGFHVLLNGGTNYYQYFTGVFPGIAIGSNAIQFSGSSSSGATLTIEYYSYYLGL